ncbi:MAG: hypothetical protein E7375_04045 [Clostridiales bacterium]|nr:hypothetical protein [Clostridiales bacterium]
MNIYDDVRVLNDKEEYKKEGVFKDMVGRIILGEIRENSFYVNFIDKNFEIHKNDPEWFEEHYDELEDDISIPIKIEDLELVKKNWATDKTILNSLPQNNPAWWCKVENGYIMNLLGDKKNKIPYDYNS